MRNYLKLKKLQLKFPVRFCLLKNRYLPNPGRPHILWKLSEITSATIPPMLKWIKRDPVIHITCLIILPFAVLLAIFIGLFIYSAFRIFFDPNYEEFGPQVALYEHKDCADIQERIFNTPCNLALWLESMDIKHPKTLNKAVEEAANAKRLPNIFQRLPKLSGYPNKSSGWECSINGKLIPNNSTEVTQKGTLYKCWPKQ